MFSLLSFFRKPGEIEPGYIKKKPGISHLPSMAEINANRINATEIKGNTIFVDEIKRPKEE